MLRRIGSPEGNILGVQTNLASAYARLERFDEALRMRRDVYSGRTKLNGEEHEQTLLAANNYATSLLKLQRFEEAKSLLRKTLPVARRFLGESNDLTFQMGTIYAATLYRDSNAMLDDLREAVRTLENLARCAKRIFGGAHPLTVKIEDELRRARAVLRAREAQSGEA